MRLRTLLVLVLVVLGIYTGLYFQVLDMRSTGAALEVLEVPDMKEALVLATAGTVLYFLIMRRAYRGILPDSFIFLVSLAAVVACMFVATYSLLVAVIAGGAIGVLAAHLMATIARRR